MKRLVFSLFVMGFLLSCSDGWNAEQEDRFINQCVSAAEIKKGKEIASKYCDCMVKKLKKKYSSFEKANEAMNTERDKIQEMVQDCQRQ